MTGVLARALAAGLQLWVEDGQLRFRAPPGALDAALKADLQAAKADLIAHVGEGRRIAPAFAGQRRLWLAEAAGGGDGAYTVTAAGWLDGALDAAALGVALDGLAARHGALRSRLVMVDGELAQIVEPAAALPLAEAAADGEDAALSLAGAAAARPFDLAEGPPARALLVRLGPRRHLFVLMLHHTVCDAPSIDTLGADLATLYDAAVRGEPLPAVPAGPAYTDFAAGQQHRAAQGLDAADLAWWCGRLADVAPLMLAAEPADPHPAGPAAGRLAVRLPAGEAAALLAAGRRVGTTPFMLLLALLALLLARRAGQTDVTIGAPVSLRGSEHAGVVGFFAGTVALRFDLGATPDLTALLAHARAVVSDALTHAAVPFERVVEALGGDRRAARHPVFQVLYTHREAAPAPAAAAVGGLVQRPVSLAPAVPKAELTVETAEGPDGLSLSLEYDRAVVDDAVAADMADGFLALCRAAAVGAGGPLAALPVLGPWAEAAHARLADTAAPYPRDSSIPARFARAAAAAPNAVAVAYGEDTLTYRALDRWSDAVAEALLAAGCTAGSVVGVRLGRGPAMIAAWLGVLKAGGAYLPLDAGHPAERLAGMVADSGAGLVLADGPAVAGDGVVRTLDVRAIGRAPSGRPRLPALDGGTAAYVVFTSGSTGRPKGTVVPHRAVLRLVLGTDYVALGPGSRVAQAANASFDAVTFEVWGPLLAGGRVVGIDADAALSADALAAALAAAGVTHLFLTTALFNAVVRARARIFAGLDTLLVGGEAADPTTFRTVLEEGAPRRLLHVYGPTEVTTFSLCHPIAAVPPGAVRLPIGRPIANTVARVLDRGLRPVALGAEGELWLGGDGLADGYCGQPALTADRFRPDPFAGASGARLYRSGDRVRLLPDGSIDFIGRIDAQVKIRGFRVEPGEIEAVLRTLPGVAGAHVAARREAGGTLALVAYLVAAADAMAPDATVPDDGALRCAVAAVLPDYMVPAAVVRLERLPLTPNGKIDAAALPAPVAATAGAAFRAPEGALEEAVAAAVAELLGVERVGRDDDFFALGGHSLAAMRLVARLKERAGIALPLRAVFEAPSVAALALRAAEADGTAAPGRIPRRSGGGPLPLSYGQERLWFIHRLQPDQRAYLIPMAVRLRGRLDVAALERAATALVARHPALRTGFATVAGRPLAVETPPAPLTIAVETVAPEVLDAALSAETARPFDLERGPLLRLALFRLGPDDHALALTLHHIAADGWSLGVLLRELAALTRDPVAALPALPVAYPDFAAWQRARGGDADLAHWTQALAGAATLALPTDRPRPPAGRSHLAGMVHRRLAPATLTALEALARREGASLFMALLAGVAALLGRLADEEDVVLGTVLAGRDHPDTEGLVGLFIQTLPLRLDLSGNPPGVEMVARARAAVLDAHAHRGVPFERIVDAVEPQRDPTRTPLFQVMVLMQNQPYDRVAFPGLEAEPLALPPAGAKYDLTIAFSGEEGGVGVEYSAALFDAASVERLVDRLERVLAALAAAPNTRLGRLPVLDDAERAAALALGRGPAAPAAVPPLLVWGADGDAPAVTGPEGTLSYAELRARVSRLAAALAAAGAGPEVRVGLCAGRSVAQVVALLAVLEAGAAYVPLDPDLPAERLAAMVEDASPAFVLAPAEGVGRLPAGVRVLDLATGGGGWADVRPCPADAAAYVLFTSGSTGRPKGVVVGRDALARHMAWMDGALPLAPGDRLLLKTPMGFDASVWEYLAAFRAGATLVAAGGDVHRSPAALLDAVAAGGVTVVQLVPSMLAAMLAEPGFADAGRTLRRVCCGGEALPRPLAERVGALLGAEVVNLYGPTEATIQTVVHTVRPGPGAAASAGATVPIGRPIDGVAALLTDRWGEPVPAGTAGRLWLAGPALARGYLGRPDLTAERFRPHPLGGPAGARVLDTGDRARFLADGTLEWLGRTDGQVKLRGYRIETGEVEAVLRRQPGVSDAVVTVDGGRLVGYAVAGGGETMRAALEAACAAALPAPMRPSALVLLDVLPRLPSGKIDRRALPRPETPSAVSTPPSGMVETLLAAVWAGLLGVPAIGRDDDFFALGGHSLLAAQLVARVQEATGVELPLTAVFEAPTLAGLAARVEAAAGEMAGEANGAGGVKPAIARLPRGGDLPLSAAQRRLWSAVRLHGDGGQYTMGGAMRLTGRLDRPALERALVALVRRHETLRTRFPEVDHLPVQRIDPPPAAVLAVEPARDDPAAAQRAADLLRHPFDLERGPLFRATLLPAGEGRHLLVLAIHHSVCDGWSMRVLTGELIALYEAFAAGRPSPLADLPVQYADYAAWRDAAAAPRREEALAYWRRTLAGVPMLVLPADRPPADPPDARGALHPLALPAAVAAGVEGLARACAATDFMVLLAALAAALHATTGQGDLALATDLADRRRREADGLIGFFANQAVLRVDLSGEPTVRALLARVRAAALGAYARQDVSFDEVAAALGPRPPSEPLVRAKLTLQEQAGGTGTMGGMAVDFLPLGPVGVPCDLAVNLVRTPQGYAGGVLYRAALFDAATVARLAGRFEEILAAMTADPERTLSSLLGGLAPAGAREASLAKLRSRRR